jgi:hypothetical protein
VSGSPSSDFDKMGVLSEGWGICGFTSPLYALSIHNPAQRARLAQGAVEPTRMLAEIKTFLRMLQADRQQKLLDDITTFTRSFGGKHKHFTITRYIERSNATVTNGAEPNNERFGIGLPPEAVVESLKRVCDLKNARVVDLSHDAHELIPGVADRTDKTMTLYDGLAHYLYKRGNRIYGWGKQFGGVTEAMKGFGGKGEVCVKIAIG